jgi:hypothetical protein
MCDGGCKAKWYSLLLQDKKKEQGQTILHLTWADF